ncbi:uncharacterized protein LOC113522316 isoform X2 [Galleria mellonella]|uniref:Uncharacterized protein LOC113522316 isoform X2 n=1 Tax=Galleria mellonella TaxID=7137 RepID=A0ABM3MZI0_GALME|nr:uncharacterized protein LOC113522316 isoform X2 [Galleria mellonella]XP_052756751.1 uncharacterized protein LOC113522316 isoform X2 [Galleria mellonella]
MSLFTQPRHDGPTSAPTPMQCMHYIEIVEPQPEDCSGAPLPPEGNVKLRNYRLLNENLRAYSPTGDIHTSPSKGKLVSRFDVCSTISPPRAKILELLRPEDPGRDVLEAIIKPAPRRGLTRPLDEDTRRFLQRALLSPSPQCVSMTTTPEPPNPPAVPVETPTEPPNFTQTLQNPKTERSLADELREAEEEERSGGNIRKELLREFRKRGGSIKEAVERERLGKLALSVEEDEGECQETELSAAARRLDALLAESRDLHNELAGIHEDIQVLARRVARRDP